MSFNLVIGWQRYETEFKGHKISMDIRPLKRWATMLLTPIYLEAAEQKKSKSKTVTSSEATFIFRVQEIGAKILPEHVRNIEGIQVNNANITPEILCEESVFASLVMDIIAELSKISELKDDEVKN